MQMPINMKRRVKRQVLLAFLLLRTLATLPLRSPARKPKVLPTSPYLISILCLRNGELSARKCLPRSWLNLILNFMCAHQKILRGAVCSRESCVALKYEKQLSRRLALNSGGLSGWVGRWVGGWAVHIKWLTWELSGFRCWFIPSATFKCCNKMSIMYFNS